METILVIASAFVFLLGGSVLLAKNYRRCGMSGEEISVSFDELKARENRTRQ